MCITVWIYRLIYMCLPRLSAKRTRSPSQQSVHSVGRVQCLGLPGKMPVSRAGMGNTQVQPKTSYSAWKYRATGEPSEAASWERVLEQLTELPKVKTNSECKK